MSKNDFLKKFAAAADLDLKQAEKVIDQITGYIKNNLSAGKDVAIPHFGVFHFKKQKARQGRHPRTGAVINIPSRNSVRFTPGKQLKEKLNIKIAREAAAAILSDAKEQAAAVKSVSAEQTSAASGRTAGYDKSAAMYTEEEPELEIPELAPDDSAAAAGQDEEKKITATADTSSSGQSQVKEQTAGEQLPAVTDTGKSLKKSFTNLYVILSVLANIVVISLVLFFLLFEEKDSSARISAAAVTNRPVAMQSSGNEAECVRKIKKIESIVKEQKKAIANLRHTIKNKKKISRTRAAPPRTPRRKTRIYYKYYRVKKGDSLWRIAKRFTKNNYNWVGIYNLNKKRIKNADLLYPGQKILVGYTR